MTPKHGPLKNYSLLVDKFIVISHKVLKVKSCTVRPKQVQQYVVGYIQPQQRSLDFYRHYSHMSKLIQNYLQAHHLSGPVSF